MSMSFDSSASLDALCEQLARATSAKKVLVCGEDGSVLAHAGERGIFTSQISAELADLVAQVLIEAQQSDPPVPVEDRFTRVGRLQACAAPIADRALLIVLFDDTADAGHVRVRVRRARPLMLRIITSSNSSQPPVAS
jgi:hypothetical protein